MKTTLYEKIILPKAKSRLIMSSSDVFTGWIDSDFRNYGLTEDREAQKTKVAVHDLKEVGTFKEIFGSLTDNLESLVMTQGQVIEFAKTIKKTDLYDYFFLLKGTTGEFFVARVIVRAGRLEARVHRLSGDDVWNAEGRHRIVVPQLAPRTLESESLTPLPLDLSDVKVKLKDFIESLEKLYKSIE